MRCRFLPLLALPLLAACWLPPYDEALSDSERLTEKLGAPVFAFDLELDSEDAEGYYQPPRDPAWYGQGFWIVRRNGSMQVMSLVLDGVSWTYYLGGSWGDYDRNGPVSVYQPTASDPYYWVVLGNPKKGFERLARDGSGNVWSDGSMAMGIEPDGAGVRPLTAGSDRYFLPAWDAAVLRVYYFDIASTEGPSVNTHWPNYPTALSPPTSPIFCAENSAADLFLSATLEDGSAATYRWPAGGYSMEPERLDFIDRTVHGILADGRLYAREDGRLRVFDPAAEKSFFVRTGNLRFAHERWDTADLRWISVFTRAIGEPDADSHEDRKTYRVEVYEFPSGELRSLAD